MSFIFANFIKTTLAANVTSTATSIQLSSSANLPVLSAGQILPITLNDAATGAVYEIVYCTAISGAVLTVTRGQENTTAVAWLSGDTVFGSFTAGSVATLNGSSGQVFQAADSTAGTQEATPRAQADTLYAPIAYSSTVTYSASETLTAAQSGNLIIFDGTAAATFTLPTPAAGLRYKILMQGTAALTLTTPSGVWLGTGFPGVDTASIVLPAVASYDNYLVHVTCDGANYNFSTPFSGLGIGQTYTNVTSSRSYSTVYTNSHNKTMTVIVSGMTVGTGSSLGCAVNGVSVANPSISTTNGNYPYSVTFTVPPGGTYEVTYSTTAWSIALWSELY